MKIQSTIEIQKRLREHKENIIQKYYQRIPLKIIAKDEDVSMQTIRNYLRQQGVKKRESIIRESNQEDDILNDDLYKRFIKDRLPFKERVNSETLLRMKENTRINQKYIKNYSLEDESIYTFLKRREVKYKRLERR